VQLLLSSPVGPPPTLSSDVSLVRMRSREDQWRDNNGGGRVGDLKFQDTDRILHRHAALPSLVGALQIWSLQALPQSSAATDIHGDIADRCKEEAQVRR
jgi:hypothetical protein